MGFAICIPTSEIFQSFLSSHIFGVGEKFESQIMADICFPNFYPFHHPIKVSTFQAIFFDVHTNPLGFPGESFKGVFDEGPES